MNRKQVLLQAKEMYPELFAEMQEDLQERLKELVQPIKGDEGESEPNYELVQAKADRRGKLLKAYQWQPRWFSGLKKNIMCCIECGNPKEVGCKTDCELAKELDEHNPV